MMVSLWQIRDEKLPVHESAVIISGAKFLFVEHTGQILKRNAYALLDKVGPSGHLHSIHG